MTPAVFGLMALGAEQVAQFFVNVLAVAGGFLVGFLVTGFVVWLLDRWLTGGKSPPVLKQACRMIGGLLLAILVALIVFGSGSGWGLFGAGTGDTKGQGTTDTTGDGKGGTTSPSTPDVQQTSTAPQPPVKDVPPPDQRVRVTVLGGAAVKEERFYLVDDDRLPKTFAEVTAAVKGKKSTSGKAVGLEVRFTADNTLPRDHPAILRLTTWASQNGVTVTFPANP
jgi:hypothetical protein